MKALYNSFTASTLLLLVVALSGCGGCVPDPVAPEADAGPEEPDETGPLSIEIVEAETVLTSLGETAQLSARVLDEGGALVEDVEIVWSSSAPMVVSASEDGRFTAVSNGEATVNVRIAGEDGAEASALVVVRQAPASLEVEGVTDDAPLVLWQLGQSPLPSAWWRDARDHRVARPDVPLTWRSLDDDVVEVGPGDVLVAHQDGSTRLVAVSDALEVELAVEVRAGLVITSCAGFEGPDGAPQESCASLPLVFVESR